MAWFAEGNHPILSTATTANNPSTSTLIAELDSTQLGTVNLAANQKLIVDVSWILGGDTNVLWQLDNATSTALGAIADTFRVRTPTGQSGQYKTRHELFTNYRLRARVASTFTGNGDAFILAEKLT